MADLEGELVILAKAYMLRASRAALAETQAIMDDPPWSRLIDHPPLVKARAMIDDPDAYYDRVRAERAAEAGGTR